MAAELGCDWHTVNDTVIGYGAQLLDDPARIGVVPAMGLDETLFSRTGKYHRLNWATTITDVSGHRLIDVVEGRDSEKVIDWLADRPRVGWTPSRSAPWTWPPVTDPDTGRYCPRPPLWPTRSTWCG